MCTCQKRADIRDIYGELLTSGAQSSRPHHHAEMACRFASKVWCSAARTVSLLLLFVLPFIREYVRATIDIMYMVQPGSPRNERTPGMCCVVCAVDLNVDVIL